jgi:hypothetical protein
MSAVASQTILSGDQMMKKSPRFSKLRVENLEERTLLAVMAGGIEQTTELVAPTEATTWVVNTYDDPSSWSTTDNIISLREAISRASVGDKITFDGSLYGKTITLNGTRLSISKGITIDASAIGRITIDANGQSGVFYISGGSEANPIEMIALTITGGNKNDSWGGDGGIYCYSGNLTIVDSVISGNVSSGNGGGLYCYSGNLSIINTVISGNSAGMYGGGIYNEKESTLNITNTVVCGNYAWGGGGIRNDGSANIVNTTITGNSANFCGGIIITGTQTFTNCIIALNHASSNEDHDIQSGKTFTDNNNLIGVDPGFVVAPNFEAGRLTNLNELDLSLTESSRAIDRGDNSFVETDMDIAGNPRICVAWKDTATVDIGAYEYQTRIEKDIEEPSLTVTTTLDVVDDTDNIISLREAILYANPGDAITFDATLAGATITLTGNEIRIDKPITIDASAIGGISVDGNSKSRVFYIMAGTDDRPVELIGLTIKNGRSEYGGGIYNYYSTMLIAKSVIDCNTALDLGGGIYNDNGKITIVNTAVSTNSAAYAGGIYNENSFLTIADSVIFGNCADEGYGGGILNDYRSILTISNTDISGNSAACGGGGIFSDAFGSLTITNTTISGNSTNEFGGGGISCDRNILSIVNTIVALNYAEHDSDIYLSGEAFSGSNNLIGFDPGFVVAPNFEAGRLTNLNELDLSLTESSWAIDRGDNSFVETDMDIAGNPRICVAWKDTATVDIGAYEYQTRIEKDIEEPSLTVTTTLDVVDDTDNIISLREAILYANPGDAITFDATLAGATITLTGNEIRIDKPITIDASTIGGISVDGNSKSRVFYIMAGTDDRPVELIGLTIKNGKTKENGGGIFNIDSVLNIADLIVSNNEAGIDGGGIYNDNAIITIINSSILSNSGNSWESCGGGIGIHSGTLTIINSIISGNISKANGGGIGVSAGTITITNSTISENSACDSGGGIINFSGTMLLLDTIIIGNTCAGSMIVGDGYYGGGISNYGVLNITNTTISANSASSGGGVYNYGEMLTIVNSTISGNSVDKRGGGIYNDYCGNLVIKNTTISENSASYGGGISIDYECTFLAYNSIIILNAADKDGTDIYSCDEDNAIDAYNTLSSFTGWTKLENCPVYDPSLPLFEDTFNEDYTLAENSQVINKGDNAYIAGYDIDLAGNPRIVNGIVDLGAYEYQGVIPAEQLAASEITTGDEGVYVSYGANQHRILWNAVENASGYELAYSADGNSWTVISTSDPVTVVTGLTYGQDVKYRVRALGDGLSYTDSDWSGVKTFNVCPMDIDGDDFIGPGDNAILSAAWFLTEEDASWKEWYDIDGDGFIGPGDYSYLSSNWFLEKGDADLIYPPAKAADIVFSEFASADVGADLDVF